MTSELKSCTPACTSPPREDRMSRRITGEEMLSYGPNKPRLVVDMIKQCAPDMLCSSTLNVNQWTTTNDIVYRHPACKRVRSMPLLSDTKGVPCPDKSGCYIQSGNPTCSPYIKPMPYTFRVQRCCEQPMSMPGPVNDTSYVLLSMARSFYGNPFLGPPYDPSYNYRQAACRGELRERIKPATRYGSLVGAKTESQHTYTHGYTPDNLPKPSNRMPMKCPYRGSTRST